jgi:hypothetical protein
MADIADSTVSTHGATRVMPTLSKMVLKFSDNPEIQIYVSAVRASARLSAASKARCYPLSIGTMITETGTFATISLNVGAFTVDIAEGCHPMNPV